MEKFHVVVWNEFRHEKGGIPKKIYPEGMHTVISRAIAGDDVAVRCATLDEPGQGLPDDVLNSTDVLLWWGHCAHQEVSDELVEKIRQRVLHGMGLIVLHSGHMSKIFRALLGTACRLRWRDVGEKERLWVVDTSHPIVRGLPESFSIPHSEMYGEPFDIPSDGIPVFMSWYEGGNVFRSGVAFQRGGGRIFYFSPGHEEYNIYYDSNIQKVLSNAVRWAKGTIRADRVTPQPEAFEKITSKRFE